MIALQTVPDFPTMLIAAGNGFLMEKCGCEYIHIPVFVTKRGEKAHNVRAFACWIKAISSIHRCAVCVCVFFFLFSITNWRWNRNGSGHQKVGRHELFVLWINPFFMYLNFNLRSISFLRLLGLLCHSVHFPKHSRNDVSLRLIHPFIPIFLSFAVFLAVLQHILKGAPTFKARSGKSQFDISFHPISLRVQWRLDGWSEISSLKKILSLDYISALWNTRENGLMGKRSNTFCSCSFYSDHRSVLVKLKHHFPLRDQNRSWPKSCV